MSKNSKIEVKGTEIIIYKENEQDFISLTDIARFRDAERSDYILQNWMRNRSTIEFMGLWEQFNNPGFNSIEFDGIKNLSGANSFSLTPKRWIEATNEENLIPKELTKKQASMVYANEAPLRLCWKGKRTTVDRIVLPLQSLEKAEPIVKEFLKINKMLSAFTKK